MNQPNSSLLRPSAPRRRPLDELFDDGVELPADAHRVSVSGITLDSRGVSEGDSITYALQRHEPLATEHQAFRDAINGDPSNIVTMREGLHTVRTVEAVLESAARGTVVEL